MGYEYDKGFYDGQQEIIEFVRSSMAGEWPRQSLGNDGVNAIRAIDTDRRDAIKSLQASVRHADEQCDVLESRCRSLSKELEDRERRIRALKIEIDRREQEIAAAERKLGHVSDELAKFNAKERKAVDIVDRISKEALIRLAGKP